VLGAYDPVHRTLDGRGNLRELEVSQQAAAPAAPARGARPAAAPASVPAPGPAGHQFCATARSAGAGSASPLGSLCRQQQSAAAGALVPVPARQQAALPPPPLPARRSV